jgi:hypothetical protein
MKTAAPTPHQSALITRALASRRYTEQHRSLWAALYKQAKLTIRHYRLTWEPEQVVDYWLDLTNAFESPSANNTVMLDDIHCDFKTISQEADTIIIPIDSLEEYGDTWKEPVRVSAQERLKTELEWQRGVHPVTEHCHLPSWCDGTSDPIEDHLEPQITYEPLVAHY